MRKFIFFLFFFFFVSKSYSLEIESFAGTEMDTRGQGFHYLACGFLTPLRKTTTALAFRIFSGYLTYEYEKQGERIIATSFVLTPFFGLRNNGLAFWVGPTIRKLEKEQRKEEQTGVFIQAELERGIRKINLGLIFSYSSEDQYFWSRGRIKKEIATTTLNSLRTGLDLIAQGNPNFFAYQMNGIFESSWRSFSLLFKSGYRIDRSKKSVYIGLEFYNSFLL